MHFGSKGHKEILLDVLFLSRMMYRDGHPMMIAYHFYLSLRMTQKVSQTKNYTMNNRSKMITLVSVKEKNVLKLRLHTMYFVTRCGQKYEKDSNNTTHP